MTDSTTIINACDASLWVDNASGTLKDISGTSNAMTIALSNKVGDSPVFGSQWPRRKSCGKDCQIDLTILYSTAADEALDILRDWILSNSNAARSFAVYLPDKNVGSDKYSGEFVLESVNIPATAGEGKPIEVKARLLIDAALSHTNVAT